MIHSKKQMTAVWLLVLALALTGCGGQEQDASAPDPETGASGDTDSKEGKRVYGNKKIYIYLTSLETTAEEGTAVLSFLNRTEDKTFSYKMDAVMMDGQKGESHADTEIHSLAGGETANMEVTFRRPDSGDVTLTECAYIKFDVTVSGYWEGGDGTLSFCVKGDMDTAKSIEEEIRRKQSLRLAAEKQDLHKDGEYIITLLEIKDEVDDVRFCFEYSTCGSSPTVKELYIGDTLVKEEQYNKIFSMGGGEIYSLDQELIQMMRDTLLAEEPLEVSIVFAYKLEAGGEDIQTPRLSFPVTLQ